jgi:hypothetical protein
MFTILSNQLHLKRFDALLTGTRCCRIGDGQNGTL